MLRAGVVGGDEAKNRIVVHTKWIVRVAVHSYVDIRDVHRGHCR
jgi:hypothetical protein